MISMKLFWHFFVLKDYSPEPERRNNSTTVTKADMTPVTKALQVQAKVWGGTSDHL